MAQKITPYQTTTTLLGYAQITSNFTTTSSSTVQVTGLSVTVTAPGSRRLEITFSSSTVASSSGVAIVEIWDGTVGSGTQIGQYNVSGTNHGATVIATPLPSAGSHTYNIGYRVTSGTGTLAAGSTSPAFIAVKVI